MGTSTNDVESTITTGHYNNGSQEDNGITVDGKKNRCGTWILMRTE